jgi:hypothetical protein
LKKYLLKSFSSAEIRNQGKTFPYAPDFSGHKFPRKKIEDISCKRLFLPQTSMLRKADHKRESLPDERPSGSRVILGRLISVIFLDANGSSRLNGFVKLFLWLVRRSRASDALMRCFRDIALFDGFRSAAFFFNERDRAMEKVARHAIRYDSGRSCGKRL